MAGIVWLLAAQAATVSTPPPAPPPPPLPTVMIPPRVLAPSPSPINRAGWISEADYPKPALITGQSGSVRYRLDVDAQGAVTGCTVIASSGFPVLDNATCTLLAARARFAAAHDALGHAVASHYLGAVAWRLPAALPNAAVPAAPALDRIGTLGIGRTYAATPQRALPPALRGSPADVHIATLPRPQFAAAPTGAAAPVAVAEDASPPADPAVRYGRLANGLRYAIMRRRSNVSGLSIRLQIAVGSLDETDAQRGFAHLIEHMLFRGSANIADGDFAKSLESIGMTLGRDTTAFTMPETTLFALDFPKSVLAPARTGLDLLREAVERATLSEAALASERGVVAAERRVRDDPAQRNELARLQFLMPGQPVPLRWAESTTEGLAAATGPALRAFYRSHYRPDAVTLVMVGDIDHDSAEAQIRAAFGDWTAQGPAPAPVDQGRVRPRGRMVHVETAPGTPAMAEIDWVTDYDRSPDTIARERRIVAAAAAAIVLGARLARLADDPAAPFVSASLSTSQMFHSAHVARLSSLPKPGQTAAALAAVLTEARRMLAFGMVAGEFDSARAELRARVARMTDGANLRDNAALAGEILNDLDNANVFVAPLQGAADAQAILDSLTPEMVMAAARRMFEGAGPLVYVSGDSAPAGGEAAIAHAIAAAATTPLAGPYRQKALAWPYTRFGEPGKVAETRQITDLGVTIVRFANGTSMTLRPIPDMHAQVLVNLNFGSGLAGLPKGLERGWWQVASPALPFVEGGLGKLSSAEIATLFAGRRVGAGFVTSDNRLLLVGETTPADLEAEVQLMTAYVVDPGFRGAAFEKARAVAEVQLGQLDATATATMQRDLTVILASGDTRWQPLPTRTALGEARAEDLAAILRPALAGPLNLVMVGDFDVARATALGAATIGALPPRGPRPATVPAVFPASPAEPVVITGHGRADDAVAVAAWPTPGFFARMRDSRGLQVLGEVIRLRLQDGLRAHDGLTYSPAVFVEQSTVFDSFGSIAASVELDPGKTDLFFRTIDSIVADLAARPISPDELARARAPMLDEARRRLRTTSYWVVELVGSDTDPRIFDTIRSRMGDLDAIGVGDIQRLAARWLAGRPYRLVFRAGSPGAAQSGHTPHP